MLTGPPLVVPGPDQQDRQRQPVPRQRLRQRHEIGVDAGLLEAEERAGAPAPGLDVIDHQQRPVVPGDRRDPAQPSRRGDVQPTFALDRLEDDGRRWVDAARRVVQDAPQQVGRVDVVEVAVERHPCDAGQCHLWAHAVVAVARRRQRPRGHPVEGVREGDHVAATGDLPRELETGLHGVGTGRTGELHVVVEVARLQDVVDQRRQEPLLGLGEQVEAVGDAAALDVVDQRHCHVRVVVPVVEGARSGQEVDVLPPLRIDQHRAVGGAQHRRDQSAVAADPRLPCRGHGWRVHRRRQCRDHGFPPPR